MILVVGDAILDVDRRFTSTRMCPENDLAPVLTPLHAEAEMRLGGALNVWAAIRALGTNCSVVSCLGNDQPGDVIWRMMGAQNHRLFTFPDANPTTVKERIYVDGVLRWRMDNDRMREDLPTYLLLEGHVVTEMENGHVELLVLSDYGKGVLARPQGIITCAKRLGIPVLVDPKGDDWERYVGATVIKPNLVECINEDDVDFPFQVTTYGDGGMSVWASGGMRQVDPHDRNEVDVTGAGDMACAALAVCLAKAPRPLRLSDVYGAAEVANVLAGWSVEFQGVKTFTKDEAIDECAKYGIAFPL